jgi:hypothetical protein
VGEEGSSLLHLKLMSGMIFEQISKLVYIIQIKTKDY